MSDQYNATKPAVKLLSDRTFSPAAINGGRVSRARVSITNNCVAIAADTGGERWTNAYLPLIEWEMFCMAVQQAVVSKEPIHLTVDISKGKPGQAQLDAILGVGRDEEGILYLSVAAPRAQEIRFTFMPNQNYRWKANGQEMASSEISRRNAQAWVTGVNRVLPLEFQANFSTYEGGNGGQKKPWQGGGNGQKKPWNGNGGGGNGQRPPYQQKAPYQQQQQPQQQQQAYQPAPQQQQAYTPPAPASMNFEDYVGQLP